MKKSRNENLDTKSVFFALENVTYTFPNSKIKSIRDISIKMEKGQSIGITGVTGAGKSTLFHLMYYHFKFNLKVTAHFALL